ncbi:helix-turn-helix transcriptional regulator [Natrononativus amylolyticus]|uniref:helix-turn-helix transcriptional regulator n=1 Tax=Natrononativus amylolyticus TaxID=2963434 RepID=UPI0020CCE736|nr:MarR family transcriptional regulator [Natrononativus amylolyticus]
MSETSPTVGYSLVAGDPVSLVLVGALVVLLALVAAYWLARSGESDDAAPDRDGLSSRSDADGRAERGLSDEERVCRWLREAGGELPQKEFIERGDWSKSKVSRLLSQMEDDGLIEKVRVGRENAIVLLEDDRESP